jgi:anti-sigma B factor antagonist
MAKSNVSLKLRKVDNFSQIIDIEGEVNSFAENALMDAYSAISASGARYILLNFSGLEFMNSSGIGLLVTLLIRASRQKQRIVAYGLSDHYRQIFELTRLNEAISILPDEATAIETAKKLALA